LTISRVCGELAVSRALGDRDFKASHNNPEREAALNGRTNRELAEVLRWDSPHLFLTYPEGHSQSFVGDLVTNQPDFQALRVGEEGVSEEFLLLACDGLWDVIDADDAYRMTRELLFERRWSAKKAAGRLAELAVHLGSSDNITVIVVRFFDR
jgi:serine/threonine protein phosphatase PrpC